MRLGLLYRKLNSEVRKRSKLDPRWISLHHHKLTNRLSLNAIVYFIGLQVKPGSERSQGRKTISLPVFERTQVVTSQMPVSG
jgi:hypothetical protein